MSKSKRKLKKEPKSLSRSNAGEATSSDAGAESATAPDAAPVPAASPQRKVKKVADKQRSTVDPDMPRSFKRPAFSHFIRYPAAFMLALLNVAIVMSFIERLPRHQMMDPFKELFFFGAVGFIDLFMLMPMIFEVNRIETDKDGLKISTLLWKTKLRWDQIVKFEQPKFLKFGILRTQKSFYLLHKYHLKPFFELAEIISAKMPQSIEDSKG